MSAGYRSRVFTVYGSGFLMGMALIIYPALSNIFKDPKYHSLTSSEYGLLFIPMIIMAILSSSLSARISPKVGVRRILLLGFFASITAMVVLALSHFSIGIGRLPFIVLLISIALEGIGFGFILSSLNTLAFDLFQTRSDTAINALHSMIGIGQAGAPVVLGLFVSLGWWGGAPLLVMIAMFILMFLARRLPSKLSTEGNDRSSFSLRKLPKPVWIFVVLALLYGISEATFGNWGPVALYEEKGLTIVQAGIALSLFWGMATFGRIALSVLALWIKTAGLYLLSPILIAISFMIFPLFNGVLSNMVWLALAGLSCSYFFPLSISFASKEASDLASSVSGLMVSSIMIGTGLGTFSVGLLRDFLGLSLSFLFRLSGIYGLVMAILIVLFVIPSKRAKRGGIG